MILFKCIKFDEKIYFIVLSFCNDRHYDYEQDVNCYNCDEEIADKIGITLEDYRQILFNFGAYKDEDNELYFNTKRKTIKAVNYLNETYGIIFKLMGD